MAAKQLSKPQQLLEKLLAKPVYATLTVGFSIVCLLQLLQVLSGVWPAAETLRFVVPFIPPFFITRAAKRINQRRAEHDFIRDAEPYIFVAFPNEATLESLLSTKPDMVSIGAGKYSGCPPEDLLETVVLPPECCAAEERQKIAEQILAEFEKNEGYGILTNLQVRLSVADSKAPAPFLVNSVMKQADGRLKWQATLMRSLQD